jgi:hypothetical protein
MDFGCIAGQAGFSAGKKKKKVRKPGHFGDIFKYGCG